MPFASLTFFRMSLIKLNLHSQRMSYYLYHITESSVSNWKIRGSKHSHLSMFCDCCVGWRHNVNICTVPSMTSCNFISHVCKARKFVIAILHGKQGLLCDKSIIVEYGNLGKKGSFYDSLTRSENSVQLSALGTCISSTIYIFPDRNCSYQ